VVLALSRRVLGAIVVEATLGHDLDRTQGAPVEHAHGDLLTGDEALDEQGGIVASGVGRLGRELGQIAGAPRAHARARATWLHEGRESEGSVQLGQSIDLVCLEPVVGRRRHVVEAEQLLGLELVHGQRAREHARACVGNAQDLEQALDAAVFTQRAVQGQEGDVDVRLSQALIDVFLDHDASDAMPALLEGLGDRFSGGERNLSLGAQATHQDSDVLLYHVPYSSICGFRPDRSNSSAAFMPLFLGGFGRTGTREGRRSQDRAIVVSHSRSGILCTGRIEPAVFVAWRPRSSCWGCHRQNHRMPFA